MVDKISSQSYSNLLKILNDVQPSKNTRFTYGKSEHSLNELFNAYKHVPPAYDEQGLSTKLECISKLQELDKNNHKKVKSLYKFINKIFGRIHRFEYRSSIDKEVKKVGNEKVDNLHENDRVLKQFIKKNGFDPYERYSEFPSFVSFVLNHDPKNTYEKDELMKVLSDFTKGVYKESGSFVHVTSTKKEREPEKVLMINHQQNGQMIDGKQVYAFYLVRYDRVLASDYQFTSCLEFKISHDPSNNKIDLTVICNRINATQKFCVDAPHYGNDPFLWNFGNHFKKLTKNELLSESFDNVHTLKTYSDTLTDPFDESIALPTIVVENGLTIVTAR